MARRGKGIKWVLLAPALLVVLVTTAYPLLAALYFSFHRWQLSRPSQVRWGEFTLDNYIRLISDLGFLNSLRVTFVFTSLSVVLSLVIGLGMALLLHSEKRLNTLAKILLIFPFAVSPTLKGFSWRFMMNPEYGIFDQLINVTLPGLAEFNWLADPVGAMLTLAFSEVWGWAPLLALMFIGALSGISPEIIEAARVDGANQFQVVTRITLPMLRPVIVIATLLKIIFSLKMFDQVVTLTGGGPGDSTQTIFYYIQQTAFGRSLDIGYASAMSYVFVIILLAFGIAYARYALKRA
jgi:multiple sugar transport system permease protein